MGDALRTTASFVLLFAKSLRPRGVSGRVLEETAPGPLLLVEEQRAAQRHIQPELASAPRAVECCRVSYPGWQHRSTRGRGADRAPGTRPRPVLTKASAFAPRFTDARILCHGRCIIVDGAFRCRAVSDFLRANDVRALIHKLARAALARSCDLTRVRGGRGVRGVHPIDENTRQSGSPPDS